MQNLPLLLVVFDIGLNIDEINEVGVLLLAGLGIVLVVSEVEYDHRVVDSLDRWRREVRHLAQVARHSEWQQSYWSEATVRKQDMVLGAVVNRVPYLRVSQVILATQVLEWMDLTELVDETLRLEHPIEVSLGIGLPGMLSELWIVFVDSFNDGLVACGISRSVDHFDFR